MGQPVSNEGGALYVVATPIGNLGDISARAGEVLAKVDVIAAEDTRQSARLLAALSVATPMVSLHEHNERERAGQLIDRLRGGESIALISDAGTPLISDPGFRLVRAARAAGLAVYSLPGPCAAIAALAVAGLPSDRFVFEGFVAARSAARQAQFTALERQSRTMIFYVAPRVLSATLADAVGVFGEQREAVVMREISKVFESYYGNTLSALCEQAHHDANLLRGECVLLIAGNTSDDSDGEQADVVLGALLEAGVAVKKAVAVAMQITGGNRNSLYARALELKQQISTKS